MDTETSLELLEAVFPMRFAPRLNGEHEAAGSNTSTVALCVVGGDEKGTQCLGLKLGHPVPGDINTRTWYSRLW
jgi:hypothetical protein